MGNLSDTETLFAILGLLSVVLFFASVFILPLIIIYLPEDYFHRTAQVRLPMTPLRMIGKILKNLIGFVLLVAGFLMLFLPGQGILCGLLGISLLDFPKKGGAANEAAANKGRPTHGHLDPQEGGAKAASIIVPSRNDSRRSATGFHSHA